MKAIYSLEVEFKADLTSKIWMGMEVDCFPTFLGNEWASRMGIGSFGVAAKTLVGKLFFRNEAFRGMKWECA